MGSYRFGVFCRSLAKRSASEQSFICWHMSCSYQLFVAVTSLQRRSFSDIRLRDVTEALKANGLSDVTHVRFAHIDDDFEIPPGSHASLLHFFVTLQKELCEGRAQLAPACAHLACLFANGRPAAPMPPTMLRVRMEDECATQCLQLPTGTQADCLRCGPPAKRQKQIELGVLQEVQPHKETNSDARGMGPRRVTCSP